MNKHNLLLAACLLAPSVSSAQADATLKSTTEGTDSRLHVSNALVTALQNSRRITLNLKWDFLPDATHVQTLRETYAMAWPKSKNLLWGEWRISNSTLLRKDGWAKAVAGLKADESRFWATVLSAGSVPNLKRGDDLNSIIQGAIKKISDSPELRIGWVEKVSKLFPPNPATYGQDQGFPKLANYRFCLSMLSALTQARGMTIKIEEETGSLTMNGPRYLEDDIQWTIRAFRSGLAAENTIKQTYTVTIEGAVQGVKFDLISTDSPAPEK
ncbi:MAG: hypothetical protein EON58_13980, partial [Alphaproteobacteria bacterium]